MQIDSWPLLLSTTSTQVIEYVEVELVLTGGPHFHGLVSMVQEGTLQAMEIDA